MRLIITVIEASDLPRANPKYKQVPYCVLHVDGMTKDLQTQPVKSSSNPKWNESFCFENIQPASTGLTITLTVMHKQRVISDVVFALDKVEIGELQGWFDLQTENQGFGGKINISLVLEESEEICEEEEEEEAEIPEETVPEQPTDNEKQEINEEDHTATEFEEEVDESVLSPSKQSTPRSKNTRLTETALGYMTKNPNETQNVDKIPERQKARENAEKKYRQFLREKASILTENAKQAEKFRQEMSDASSVQNL